MENCDVEAATVVKGTVRLSTVTTVSIPMITFKLFLKTMPTILLIWTNSLAILNTRLHQLYRLAMVYHAWRLVYNMTQGFALCCVVTGSAYKMIWMATQCRNRNVFHFCHPNHFVCTSGRNTAQALASYYKPALNYKFSFHSHFPLQIAFTCISMLSIMTTHQLVQWYVQITFGYETSWQILAAASFAHNL